MKSKLLVTIFTITIGLMLPVSALAQSKASPTVLSVTQDQREQQLEASLGLSVPNETDNPNQVVTFQDKAGKGVKLEIDGQGLKAIKSPYPLPALGIGSHTLAFQFTDTQQSLQTVDKTLVVIPRVPVLSAPETISSTEISISGTALSNSTVELFLVGDTTNIKASTATNSDGAWKYTFSGKFKYAVYTILARTKKNGFSSNISEPTVFELSNGNNTTNTDSSKAIYFNFGSITLSNLLNTIQSNPHLIILIVVSIVLGGLIAILIDNISSKKGVKNAEGKFASHLDKKDERVTSKKVVDNDNNEKNMTLREKFEKAGFKLTESKDKKEEIKEERNDVKKEVRTEIIKEEKTKEEVTRDEFMKEFKSEDPDNDKGEEPKPEKKEEPKKKLSFSLLGKVKKDDSDNK